MIYFYYLLNKVCHLSYKQNSSELVCLIAVSYTHLVVTCTYNAEKELQRTLDSVQRQTYCNIEHIIMDGGSRDRRCV